MTAAQEMRARPLTALLPEAEAIVNCDACIRIFAACEWDELSADGQLWVAAIVREASARALETRQ